MSFKVMTIFGTRPEAVKMAPVVKALEQNPHLESITCVTAQHREMLDQVLELFEITPQHDLNIMRERQGLNGTLRRALEGLDEVLEQEQPQLVLVHGDTLTTFAGAIAAFYRQVAIGHVEAGLRTFDKYFPFPEEMNRKLTGALADLHFSPTGISKQNLLNEGVPSENIYITGNTAIDALRTTVKADYQFEAADLRNLDFSKPVVAVELHRRENWGEPISAACRAVRHLVDEHPEIRVVFPVHLNPVVRESVFPLLSGLDRVILLDPLGTAEYHNLVARAHMVISDSGGIQEEAPSLGKPVLVVRTVTERPEAVAAGTVKVVGVDEERIYNESKELLTSPEAYRRMSQAKNPYGDGQAAERIVEAIEYFFKIRAARPADYNL